MAYSANASARWSEMDGMRRGFITRCEKYAGFTIPKLCTPVGYKQNDSELQHDFQAVGAQAVNFLSNKIMLALFAPSRPFFRLDASPEFLEELKSVNMSEQTIVDLLSKGEKEAIAELDRMALRPKLYEALKHLIVTGNALMILEPEGARVVGIKNYCVRRSMSGKVLEILHVDRVMFDELEPDVQDTVRSWVGGHNHQDREVALYRWFKRNAVGDYEMTQWVDQWQLPQRFSGSYTETTLPYRVLTWDLSDDAHYGTGLVEDYQGDFAGLSMMSKAQITGAILSSEFRWLVNPGGMTKPEDLEESENGSAIPGNKDDVSLIQSSKSGDLQIVMQMSGEYINRIGRGFLMGSAVTRNAERVTAEEIRMQAQELETSLGGAYSRLAVDFQIPMAFWLLEIIGFSIQGNKVRPSVVTGMEALSRSGDLDDFKLLLIDLAQIAQLPEALQGMMDMRKVFGILATPRRIKIDDFFKSEKQIAEEQAAFQQQQLDAQATAQGVQTAGKVVENQSKGQA